MIKGIHQMYSKEFEEISAKRKAREIAEVGRRTPDDIWWELHVLRVRNNYLEIRTTKLELQKDRLSGELEAREADIDRMEGDTMYALCMAIDKVKREKWYEEYEETLKTGAKIASD